MTFPVGQGSQSAIFIYCCLKAGLFDDCHLINQMTCACKLVDNEQCVSDVDTCGTLQLWIVGNVACKSFVVTVETGSYQLALAVEYR